MATMPPASRPSPQVLLILALGQGCGSDWDTPAAVGGEGGGTTLCAGEVADQMGGAGGGDSLSAHPAGLHAAGNQIRDSNGDPIVLRGVNRSGSEYKCIQGGGFFDGAADEQSVRAMASWNINAVRVPLNEACWLGISQATDSYAGENYKRAIKTYVSLLHRYRLVPILDLHWAAPGDTPPTELWPMPNADHSAEFWADVARTFLDDDGVVFEPYNEPFPDSNDDTVAAWQCWRDGCETDLYGRPGTTYLAVGFQRLVDAIRETGSTHLILLGGVQYSNSLSRWLEYMPVDPAANLGAAWHVYNFNACRDASCWDRAPAQVADTVPIVATEIGQDDCQGDFITALMQWLDARNSGYLAWSWNMLGPCVPASRNAAGRPWPLITDYCTATPNSDYARAFHRQLNGAP